MTEDVATASRPVCTSIGCCSMPSWDPGTSPGLGQPRHADRRRPLERLPSGGPRCSGGLRQVGTSGAVGPRGGPPGRLGVLQSLRRRRQHRAHPARRRVRAGLHPAMRTWPPCGGWGCLRGSRRAAPGIGARRSPFPFVMMLDDLHEHSSPACHDVLGVVISGIPGGSRSLPRAVRAAFCAAVAPSRSRGGSGERSGPGRRGGRADLRARPRQRLSRRRGGRWPNGPKAGPPGSTSPR